jgi:DNA modification methylase
MGVMPSKITGKYAIYNGDCMDLMASLPGAKVDFSVYSPPFAGLYNYTSDERDFSNCGDYKEFYRHYGFAVAELARITKPGRLTAVHCTDIPMGNTGKDALHDLPGEIIRLHESLGWSFVARHTIWKEPLWVRNRTLTKSLAHRTIVDDSAYAGVASADYLLMFRNAGVNAVPVAYPTGLDYYAGEEQVPEELLKYKGWKGDQKQNRYSHWIWRRYASSVWDDIRMGNVLDFQNTKDPDDERHVHPLQKDVIERAIQLRSNPGEIVFTPFLGVGSEAAGAVALGRKAIGAEIKESYFRQAVVNLDRAETSWQMASQQSLSLDDGADWVME